MNRTMITAVLLACSALASVVHAQVERFRSQKGEVTVETIATGLVHPWGLAFLPDGRMLVTERPGRLRIVNTDGSLSDPVDGVPKVYAEGQGGLLDVAIDPAFADNALVYLSYAEELGNRAGTAVSRGVLRDGALHDVELLYRQEPKVPGGDIHFGSRLVFDGKGHLFITQGERNQRIYAQQLDKHQGKIVRIYANGLIPDDNPFTRTKGALPEIWSYGHRNVQGAALHPTTGELWTHEHGPRGGDEINIARAGRNYGWPVIGYGINYSGRPIPENEGTTREDIETPIHVWDPSIAPSGMAFYTHDRFPAWKNNLFVGALAFQLLVRLELDGESVVAEERLLLDMNERIRDVRVGPDGYLYLLTDSARGTLLKVGLADEE